MDQIPGSESCFRQSARWPNQANLARAAWPSEFSVVASGYKRLRCHELGYLASTWGQLFVKH